MKTARAGLIKDIIRVVSILLILMERLHLRLEGNI